VAHKTEKEERMADKDRRKSRRVKAHRLVAFRRAEEEGASDYEGFVRTLDLGLGGLLLETDFPFDPGEELSLQMLSGDKVLSAKGQVVYRKRMNDKFKVGIRFTQMNHGDLKAIEKEVEE
jgi:hypothetical protein